MKKSALLLSLILLSLACVIPGFPGAQMTPFPTFDPNAPGTIIAETAAAAQTQTALKIPTGTSTPLPTRTASITPTLTPTFLWALPTLTPIPTNTLPPTLTPIPKQANAGDSEDGEEGEPKNKDEDPRKFTGKQWSCVVVGTYPPRNTVFKSGVRFVVQWTVFNAGTNSWGYNDLDFVWKGGFRHEETKIQDLPHTVPSGGEIKLTATFIAPKNEGEFQSFFHLTVGKKDFCKAYYVFQVIK